MSGTPKKVLLAAIAFYTGSLVSAYISAIPSPPDVFTISDPNWSVWDYLSLLLLMCAVGLTVAGIKLRR
ncbi:MAG TPA: hypothetical protein VJ180_01575 [Pyrinomonadaceae bacterium]|nr:hypothetical protein [Pyrinomonadaceae bacterium]